jgi:histidinol-phosphatase
LVGRIRCLFFCPVLREAAGTVRDDLDLAHALADVADSITLGCFRRGPKVKKKIDGTAVSQADLEVDAALVTLLQRERATDEVLSEESGSTSAHSATAPAPSRRWILDPIDGTDPFLAGQRSWGTHIALEVDGELQLAILTRPTEQHRWWAVHGVGAWSSPTSAPTSTERRLAVTSTAELTTARIGGFVPSDSPLVRAAREHARWTEDPLGPIVGLIEGRLDAVLSPAGAVWDHAPQVLLTLEAGGRYTDRAGGHQHDAGGGLYTNGLLDHAITATPGLRPKDWAR